MRYSIYAGSVACAFFAVWYWGLSGRVVTTVTAVIDPCLSSSTRESLKDFIAPTSFQQDSKTFSGRLHQQFGCIHTISSIRKQRTHAAIKLTAYPAAVVVNETQVITDHGLLIPAHFYRADIVSTLPHITTQEILSDAELKKVVEWTKLLPAYLLENGIFVWKNPTEIQFFFKRYPKNPVLLTMVTELSPARINAIEKLSARDDVTLVDARFEGMLVATQPGAQSVHKNKRRG